MNRNEGRLHKSAKTNEKLLYTNPNSSRNEMERNGHHFYHRL